VKLTLQWKLVAANLATAVFKDEVDVFTVLEVTVKLNNVGMIKWSVKFYLTHYLYSKPSTQFITTLHPGQQPVALYWEQEHPRAGHYTSWPLSQKAIPRKDYAWTICVWSLVTLCAKELELSPETKSDNRVTDSQIDIHNIICSIQLDRHIKNKLIIQPSLQFQWQ